MVRWWKYTKAFFRLIRYTNLLIIALTMYLVRVFLVVPVLREMNFISRLSELDFAMLVLATISIAAAGYVINDYFDRKADLINRPGKVILGRLLRRRVGMVWHFILNGFGVALGVLLSYKLGLLKFGIVFLIISGLLWFYSTTYKKQVLLGNLVVAAMVAMVPLLILLYELPLLSKHYRYVLQTEPDILYSLAYWIGGYSLFAFLLTFIREVVKDMEDFEGDAAFASQTIPIAWGKPVARAIVLFTNLLILVFALLAMVFKLHDTVSLIYIGLVTIAPLLLFTIFFYRAEEKEDLHRCSSLLKLIMVGGLLYLPVSYLFIF